MEHTTETDEITTEKAVHAVEATSTLSTDLLNKPKDNTQKNPVI